MTSSGDREWGERATAAGVRGVYARDARVAHPARRSLGELGVKIRRLALGAEQLRKQRNQPPLSLTIVRAFFPPPRSMLLADVDPPTVRCRALFVGVFLCYHYWGAWERVRVGMRRWRSERSACSARA
jgi:hypothetical protein